MGMRQAITSPARRLLVSAAVALPALVLGTACGDDAEDSATTTQPVASSMPSESTSPSESTTTTESPVSTTVAPLPDDAIGFALWPDAAADIRFDDPIEAARSFATELAGFDEPVVGEFKEGDSRSGEVEVRPTKDGPVSLVLVRQLSTDDSWWVTAALNADIVVDDPQPQGAIDHPVLLSGEARAYEGTVQVAVYTDGDPIPIGEGFVTGSGGAELGPFDGEIDIETPQGGWGALVLYTTSAEDGSVWGVTAVRVGFIGGD